MSDDEDLYVVVFADKENRLILPRRCDLQMRIGLLACCSLYLRKHHLVERIGASCWYCIEWTGNIF